MTSSKYSFVAFARGKKSGLPSLAAVAAGGLIGSLGRAAIGIWIPTPAGGFPTAVLAVNLAGSFLLGFYLARRERAVSRRTSLQFWAIGIFGSFTTFSAFSSDLVQMLADGRLVSAVSYLAVSIVGGLWLALIGQRLGTFIP